MLLDHQVLAFAVVALVLSVTPGPDMALVLRNGLRGGTPAAYRTIAGVATGMALWITASSLGVAALLAASATVFTVLKILGGAYLVYLGIQALLSARRGDEPHAPRIGRTGSPYRQGLVTNLLNPKLGVLFTTLLPQFISKGDPVLAKSLLLAGVFVAIGLTWLMLYANLVQVIGRSRVFRRVAEAVSGLVLIGLGVRIALER